MFHFQFKKNNALLILLSGIFYSVTTYAQATHNSFEQAVQELYKKKPHLVTLAQKRDQQKKEQSNVNGYSWDKSIDGIALISALWRIYRNYYNQSNYSNSRILSLLSFCPAFISTIVKNGLFVWIAGGIIVETVIIKTLVKYGVYYGQRTLAIIQKNN